MRFVDEQGHVLNIYQQLTQIADDHLLNLAWGGVEKIDAEAAVEVSRAMLRSQPTDPFTAVVSHFHVDPFWFGGDSAVQATSWLRGTLDNAAAQGIPIWSAQEWLHFTEVRHDANLENVQWSPANGRLSFRFVAPPDPTVALTVMMPLSHAHAQLTQLAVDGGSVIFRERRVGGVDYGWVSVLAGSHQIEATYG
jgi:hypothetical protein